MSITIGVSKASGSPKFNNYLRWLEHEDVRTIDLMEVEGISEQMAQGIYDYFHDDDRG